MRVIVLLLFFAGLPCCLLAQPGLVDEPMLPVENDKVIDQFFQQHDAGDVNPALLYWQAIAAYYAVPAAARDRWTNFENETNLPLPKAIDSVPREKLAAIFQGADFTRTLDLTRKAAEQTRIPDWGVNYSRGFFMELPHLREIRALIRLLLWSARYQQLCGNTDEAITELLDTFRTARQLTRQGDYCLIELLVQKAIEKIGIEATALLLPKFTKEQTRRLATELADLPPGGSFAQAMVMEQRMALLTIAQFSRQYTATAAAPEQRAQLMKLITEVTGNDQGRWMPDFLADPQLATALEKRYAALRDVLALPENRIPEALNDMQRHDQQEREQFLTQVNKLIATLPLNADRDDFAAGGMNWARKNNPAFVRKFEALIAQTQGTTLVIWGLLSPDVVRVYSRVAESDEQSGLLRAGLQVQTEGVEVLSAVADPFVPQPYIYQKTPKGFRLTSAFKLANVPVSLAFGE